MGRRAARAGAPNAVSQGYPAHPSRSFIDNSIPLNACFRGQVVSPPQALHRARLGFGTVNGTGRSRSRKEARLALGPGTGKRAEMVSGQLSECRCMAPADTCRILSPERFSRVARYCRLRTEETSRPP